MAENKKITLHPLNQSGQPDTNVNLFPKTLASALVKDDGTSGFDPQEKLTAGTGIVISEQNEISLSDDVSTQNRPLPYFSVNGTDIVKLFMINNNVSGKAIILYVDNWPFLASLMFTSDNQNSITFELESVGIVPIVRYAGSFVSLSGSDTFSGLLMSSTYSEQYELDKNKVTSLSGSSTDTEYPSAKCVYDNLVNVREVAEGKCNTFVLSYAMDLTTAKSNLSSNGSFNVWNNTTNQWENKRTELLNGDYDSLLYVNNRFNSQSDFIIFPVSAEEIVYSSFIIAGTGTTLYLINMRPEFTYVTLSNFPLKIGDIFLVIETDVPDRWYSDNGRGYKLETSKINLSQYYTKSEDIVPPTDNSKDIGSATKRFKDLYLSGKIKDGTNEFNFDNVFNVINASDIVSNTLTQAQYDLITNGKPTLIKGTLLGYENLFILSYRQVSTIYVLIGLCSDNLVILYITASTKAIAAYTSSSKQFNLRSISSINGKTIPNYPTTNTRKQALTIGANGGNLAYENFTQLYKHSVNINGQAYDLVIIDNDFTSITKANLVSRLQTCVSRKWDIYADGTVLSDIICAYASGSEVKIVIWNHSTNNIQTSFIADTALNNLTETVESY